MPSTFYNLGCQFQYWRRSDLSIKIREGTEYEEVIGVKRNWIYQYRRTAFICGSRDNAYYDIAILELGK